MSNLLRLFMKYLRLFFLSTILNTSLTYASVSVLNNSSRSIADQNDTQLNNALSFYQEAAQQPWERLPENTLLKKGDRGKSVLLLRYILKLNGDLTNEADLENPLFSASLKTIVKSFQTHHGLKPDGVVGKLTLQALNVSPQERVKQIQLNIERWSKLNSKLKDRCILVNIPDYQMYLIEDHEVVLRMKTIVGRPERQTPELSSKITRIIFNPYWHVPDNIAKKDILPKVQHNPDYLDEMNIKVISRQSRNTILDHHDIDWNNINTENINFNFRQDPGENNSLGLVKFEFPNPYDVYMHDTPAKSLFDADERDFSSGCIRLENPFELVNYLMEDDPHWNNDDAINALIDSKETTSIYLPNPIPILITYITARVDEDGNLNFRDDIYNRDQATDNMTFLEKFYEKIFLVT